MHRVANPVYLSRFLFSGLPPVARYCARGGVRVVSISVGYVVLVSLSRTSVRLSGASRRANVSKRCLFHFFACGSSTLSACPPSSISGSAPLMHDISFASSLSDLHPDSLDHVLARRLITAGSAVLPAQGGELQCYGISSVARFLQTKTVLQI